MDHTQSVTLPASTFKITFFDLPAELRNQIYSLALVQPDPIVLPYAYEKHRFAEPALLAASRRVRTEAAAVFYGANVFSARSPASAQRFLKRLSPANIKQLRMFRPVDLALSLYADRRWFDALRNNVNRVVEHEGKGELRPEAVWVPFRMRDYGDKDLFWCPVADIEDFEVVHHGDSWSLGWREAA